MMSAVFLLPALLAFPFGLQERSPSGNPETSSAGKTDAIRNPYFEKRVWRLWRLDETPIRGVVSMVREGKKKKAVEIDLAPPPKDRRIYPVWPVPDGGPLVRYEADPAGAGRFAGIWDDVYSSWSGLHGYIRWSWRGPDGSRVSIKDRILDFVDVRKREMMRAGVNFIHQSTTGMAHTITNGYSVRMTTTYERLYFADLLVCSPAHASFTDWNADRTSDLYICHSPTLFNSVGSSNSETMAITKMILVGGYLPPETKLLLKKNGLYPSALLYLWKAGLPYDVPYEHELRHRICYKSVGDRTKYPERYSAAGIDRGDMALAFHRYDDLEHMRRMIRLARSMNTAPPEACFEVLGVEGGTKRFALYKSACILQEKGQTVKIDVSTAKSYDLQGLPLKFRWKLLYGNRRLRIEAGERKGEYRITVPWDDALPEGRTVLALFANNGRLDGNPALLTIYRKKGPLPPNGGGYKDYRFDLRHSNRRPILLGLQDVYVRPGSTVEIPLAAYDPEGFPVTFAKRSEEVGVVEGGVFRWKCPRKPRSDTERVTIIASDGTSGNSYTGKTIRIRIGRPKLLAHIQADRFFGKAPLKVAFSAKGSIVPLRKASYEWTILEPARKKKPKPLVEGKKGKKFSHVFRKPGIYEVGLKVAAGGGEDSSTVRILVESEAPRVVPARIEVRGEGLVLEDGADRPNPFDGTDFGTSGTGGEVERTFLLVNPGSRILRLASKSRIALEGENAKDFRILAFPPRVLPPGGSAPFKIRFRPKSGGPGVRKAWVRIRSLHGSFRFGIAGKAGD